MTTEAELRELAGGPKAVEPTMVRIRKSFRLEMAHQLVSAYSEVCVKTIHGHSYLLELIFEGATKDDGMVLDFGRIKDELVLFFAQWDHSLVLCISMDTKYLEIIRQYNDRVNFVTFNPTAEELAMHFYQTIHPILPQLVLVRLHETKTGYAEYPVQ